MYELILYLKFYVKSEKTFQRSFKRLNVEKLVHNVLTFYRFNNHGASHLLIARADAPAAPPTSSFSRQHPLPGLAHALAWLDPPSHPPPFFAFAGSVAAAAFLAGSTLLRPFRRDPPSLWLDHVFLAGSVAAVAFLGRICCFPLLFCRGRGHHDRRRRVRCCRPPWRGSLTPGQSNKQEGRPAGALLLCRLSDR